MDDFISRQSAIDALGERPMVWTEDNEYDLGCASQYDSDRLAIETVPSADVQPVRHGHWILQENQNQDDVNNGNYLYFCSNCNHGDVHAKTVEVPFCWFCGTTMDGKHDG